LWSEGRVPFAGGAEVQQAILARGLAARGFTVSVVCCDYGQPARAMFDGVTVLRAFRPFTGLPGLRFFHPRLSLAVRALLAARADVYYARGSGFPAGLTHDVARWRGAGFVFGAAHDHDAHRRQPLARNPRDRWWSRRAVLGADAVIAQTETQRELFAREFGIASDLVRNAVELPARPVDPARNQSVVWLATYKPAKRPEWFLELARRLPQQSFVMAGVIPVAPETRAAWEAACAAARSLPNLEMRGYVTRERLDEFFATAALLVHTSPVEGFPNTVLEAWGHGVPTVTVVDPDGVVGAEGLGGTATELPALVERVAAWMADPARRAAAGARARAHVEREHAPSVVLERMAGILDRVIDGVRRPHGGAHAARRL
jgi:glycosyltransferase involved in cell wall biosynthesis